MSEKTIAEHAAELARTLSESSVLEYWNDPAERKVGHFLNGERISPELFAEVRKIILNRWEQECVQDGHRIPEPRCTRCGHRPSAV